MARSFLLAIGLCLTAPALADRPAIALASVDLNRMYGDWYIVATIPNFLEKGMVEPRDVFSPGENGTVHEHFSMRRASFDATVRHYSGTISIRQNTHDAYWVVAPIWPLRIPWLIFYVDPQYRYALFGEQNRDWGWIYSRTPRISDDDYADLMGRFSAMGYDITRFRKVLQFKDQLGVSGYWNQGVAHRSCRK
jgi:apolipoprotein D and lipocalin family protein